MDLFAILDDTEALRAALAADPAAARQSNAAGATLLAQALYMGRREAAAVIRAALPEPTPYEAIILGEEAAVRAALAAGWDANAASPDGYAPLALAAFFGHEAIFDLLLPLTCDLNHRASNPQQVAAIHAASAARKRGMVAKLLRAGADPDLTQQGGFTALHAAAQHGDAEMAGLLLLAGAGPAVPTADGRTAADFAREAGDAWLAARLGG